MPDIRELKYLQSLPLERKIEMTAERIEGWYDYFDGNVAVSFSGGKDSTVFKVTISTEEKKLLKLGTGGLTMAVRPIDANALREKIMTENYDNDTINNFLDLVDFAPTLDYEPVVHCRDCKHRNKEYSETFCEVLGRLTNDNFYCSYGAKMDEEVKD